jgi:hypothetical protein
MKRQLPCLLICALLLTQCDKADPSPEEQLPAATQTGANTFGCLLNGQPWVPDEPLLLSYWPAYKVTYDSLKAGGSLTISVARFISEKHDNQSFIISALGVQQPGSYPVDGIICGVHYFNLLMPGACSEFFNAQYYNPGNSTHVQGRLTIIRLDRKKKIVAGLFEFALAKSSCDTVKVTKGRFDRQYL